MNVSTRCLASIAALLVSLSLGEGTAHAIDFTALGGLNFAAPTQRSSGSEIHWTGDPAFSYGATVAVPVFLLPFEVETGLFVLQENSSRDGSGSGSSSQRKNRMLQIPLVLRFNLDEHIGLGLGGYFAFAQGQIESTTNNVTTLSTFESAGEKNSDAGLIVNVRARFNLAPPLYFIVDARYQHGLSNRALASADLYNTRSVQGFAGFQFSFLSSHDEE